MPEMNDWTQTTLQLPRFPRGFHLITDLVLEIVPSLPTLQVGFLHVFIMHTSASLTINENADPDVRRDFETASNLLCPQDLPFRHTSEGPDDMPAHVMAAIFGSQLLIPIRQGKLTLGVWQGIYLCEHRDNAGPRHLVLTLFGQRTEDLSLTTLVSSSPPPKKKEESDHWAGLE
jgi:secondary thiamine-phosphate synthase enzyme